MINILNTNYLGIIYIFIFNTNYNEIFNIVIIIINIINSVIVYLNIINNKTFPIIFYIFNGSFFFYHIKVFDINKIYNNMEVIQLLYNIVLYDFKVFVKYLNRVFCKIFAF